MKPLQICSTTITLSSPGHWSILLRQSSWKSQYAQSLQLWTLREYEVHDEEIKVFFKCTNLVIPSYQVVCSQTMNKERQFLSSSSMFPLNQERKNQKARGKLEGIIKPPSNKAKHLVLETYKFMLQGIYVMPILTLFIGVQFSKPILNQQNTESNSNELIIFMWNHTLREGIQLNDDNLVQKSKDMCQNNMMIVDLMLYQLSCDTQGGLYFTKF